MTTIHETDRIEVIAGGDEVKVMHKKKLLSVTVWTDNDGSLIVQTFGLGVMSIVTIQGNPAIEVRDDRQPTEE